MVIDSVVKCVMQGPVLQEPGVGCQLCAPPDQSGPRGSDGAAPVIRQHLPGRDIQQLRLCSQRQHRGVLQRQRQVRHGEGRHKLVD